jgi:hypothetical protein
MAKIPFEEKVPWTTSLKLPAAYLAVTIISASHRNFPQKNGGMVRKAFTLATAAAVKRADEERGVSD